MIESIEILTPVGHLLTILGIVSWAGYLALSDKDDAYLFVLLALVLGFKWS